jgi:hypothetical protein
VRSLLLVGATAIACAQGTPDNARYQTPAPPSTQVISEPPLRWYPMADAAVPLPAACSAQCSLDCDLWAGSIACPGDVGGISVWGGLSSMAGMQLDQPGARLEGAADLTGGGRVRWGVGSTGEFCGTVGGPPFSEGATKGLYWTWQLCAPDSPSRREAILSIVRGYSKTFPANQVLECVNRGC